MLLIGDWVPEKKHGDWHSKDAITLANLEGPVLPSDHRYMPATKAGPHLFSTSLPAGDERFVFSLANNHIMDYGMAGLEATQQSLDRKHFKACGAGHDISAARRPIVIKDNRVQVGIIACGEAQFGVARHNQGGIAEIGPWIYRAIGELRQTLDAVVVSVHAAVEDSPWPSPYIQGLYRSFIDAGAAVIHGHHSHVPQGIETYGNGVIFYGMGNFMVDPDRWRHYTNGLWSLGAEIDFQAKPPAWRLLTFEIRHRNDSNRISVEESSETEQSRHKLHLEKCNLPLGDTQLLEALWQEVALRAYFHYGASYMRFPHATRRGRLTRIKASLRFIRETFGRLADRDRPRQHDALLWHLMFACESHRQMFATALGVLGGEIKDLRTEETRRLADEMTPWSRGAAWA